VAALLGHTTLRMWHMADLQQPARDEELAAMVADLAQAMADGALGLSSGVFYKEAFAADPTELSALASAAARAGGLTPSLSATKWPPSCRPCRRRR
jgi:N-acyl-D-amino-acid deacylase